MGQKIKPTSIRIGVINDWSARWYPKNGSFKEYLEEDIAIRKVINEKIAAAGIDQLVIERVGDALKIYVKAAKPGLIIGRGGKGIEDLSKSIEKKVNVIRSKRKAPKIHGLSLNIEELKRTEISAAVTAQNIARDIERRMPFRRIMKKSLENIMQNRDVKGAKIRIAGRLNGAEIARAESLAKGKMPLQTIRAKIDYAEATAFTTFGTIGIKVWINKGEVFNGKNRVNHTDGYADREPKPASNRPASNRFANRGERTNQRHNGDK